MRVSEQSRLASRIGYLQTVSQRLDKIQQELSTGRKIQRSSDDPAGASLALNHRQNLTFETQLRRNLSSGVSFMNATEAALGGATDVLQRVRELTIQASNDTLSPSERTAAGAEVNQLIGEMAQLANTSFGGAYIFAGHRSDAPAYQVTGTPPSAVTFMGDTGQRVRRISKQDAVAINVAGSNVFGTVFDDLITLRNQMNGSASGTTISGNLGAIDDALGRVLDARAEVGARVNRFEAAQRVSEQADTDLQKLRAEIEEIDLSETIVKFTAQETAYQAALAAMGKTANMTLLNFL
ncbi:MAG: flagellar hook-associated protein FlgL [Dehalococcoidia bacterium]|nr:flagellar hook-associated protein FlgL [Dehalococcoidia bacterium]